MSKQEIIRLLIDLIGDSGKTIDELVDELIIEALQARGLV